MAFFLSLCIYQSDLNIQISFCSCHCDQLVNIVLKGIEKASIIYWYKIMKNQKIDERQFN